MKMKKVFASGSGRPDNGMSGSFEVTHDVSRYTCARFLSESGKVTSVVAHFRNFDDDDAYHLKFLTEEGHYDFSGKKTPQPFIREAMKYPDFIHRPLSHPVTGNYTEQGLPFSFRYMYGFSSPASVWYNGRGDCSWVKSHYIAEEGIRNLSDGNPEASECFHNEGIHRHDFPSWTVFIQIMSANQATNCAFDPFDNSRSWSHAEYPLQPMGRLVLRHNCAAASDRVSHHDFSPANSVPGIESSPVRLLQGSLFCYPGSVGSVGSRGSAASGVSV